MASTGPEVFPSTSLFPGTGEYPGQGEMPLALLLYSTDDAATVPPTWTDATAALRAFSISRGRETELADVDAGTATFTLDDRDRTFDPTFNTAIRPMNQWWMREQFSGSTHSLFKGYAESYQEQWVKGAEEAATVVSCADEFKKLARDHLPTTDPTRDSYADLVLFDEPQGYWRMQDQGGDLRLMAPAAGSVGLTSGSIVPQGTPIVGDWPLDTISGTSYGARSTTTRIYTYDASTLLPGLDVLGPGDAAGLSSFSFETWFRSSEATPAAKRTVATGPLSGGNPQWGLALNTSGALEAFARNSGGTLYTAAAGTTIAADTWYHLAIVVTGTNTLLYINGVLISSASFTGTIGTMDASEFMYLGTATAVGGTRYYDEAAFYRTALAADRILAHHTAGTARGFPADTTGSGDRVYRILQLADTNAPTNLTAGTRIMSPTYMTGQSPLDALRQAENAENGDAILFTSRDGTITYLDGAHRTVSPWNTVQATFDDDGTDFPYQDIGMDYSDAFIANEWNVTRTGGTTATATDATSIARYGKRSQSLTDLHLNNPAHPALIAAALLAKYKDPMRRVTSLTLLPHTADLIDNVYQRDIGDRVRVFRTPPGGGARLDQTVFVQKISVEGRPGQPWRVVLGLSPL